MARKTSTAVAPATPETVTDAGVESALTLAAELDACLTSEARLATLTLAIHKRFNTFETKVKAYDKARVAMVTAGVPAARVAAQLIQYAEANKVMLAERGPNAGKPAVMHLATHLGYERRRFEPIHKAALALIEAGATLAPEADVTPEDLEIVGPHLSKDAKRQAVKAAEVKAAKTETAPAETADAEETAGAPAVTAPDSPVILADVLTAIAEANRLALEFAKGNGLTRDTMDGIQDALAGISSTLEAIVAE